MGCGVDDFRDVTYVDGYVLFSGTCRDELSSR